jgi:hypothetical protein
MFQVAKEKPILRFGWNAAIHFVLLQPRYFRDWIEGIGRLRLRKCRHCVVPLSA